MKTISAIAQKGGTGKTTILLNLACEFARRGYLTAIMDLDPQPSAMAWRDLRKTDDPPVLDTKASRLAQAKEEAARQGLDVLLVDTGGRTDEGAFTAAQLSDLVIVPMQPSAVDMASMQATQQLIQRAGNPKAVAVLSRVKAAGTRHHEAAEGLRAQGWNVLDAAIGDRVVFQDAYAAGKTVGEYGSDPRAMLEIQELYRLLCQHVGLPTIKQTQGRTPRTAPPRPAAGASANDSERTQYPFGRLRDRR